MGCVVVQQKPMQYCKAIFPQLKINFKKRWYGNPHNGDPSRGMRQMFVYETETAFNILICRKKISKRLIGMLFTICI